MTLHIGEHYAKQAAHLEMTLIEIESILAQHVPAVKNADDIERAITIAAGITIDAIWEVLRDQIEDIGELT